MPPKARDNPELQKRALAFCMSLHERLGKDSMCTALPPEVVKYITILNTGYCFIPTPHSSWELIRL